MPTHTLAQRLGYQPDTRLLILNADDFGMCKAATDGILPLLHAGAVTSTTLMTPCGWAPYAAQAVRDTDLDVGLHLVFTSEWEAYRWAPVGTPSPSLVDASGYFPADCASFEASADPSDVTAEMHAQLARMRALGLEPTHADNHMGSLYGLATGRDFLEPVLRFCAEHGLPFRLPRNVDLRPFPVEAHEAVTAFANARVALADELGVEIPDFLLTHPFELETAETYETLRDGFIHTIQNLEAGVTEYYIHPFELTDELRALSPDAQKRAWEVQLATDPVVTDAIRSAGVTLIGWRELQQLQHGGVR